MGIEDVGVRFVTEGATQFEATMKRADKAVDDFGNDATKAAKKSSSSFSGMEKAINTIALDSFVNLTERAVSGLITVGKAVKGLADNFMNYAFEVKDFGRIIGATPEEASKLIQVADDVRLSVGSMTVAMRTAISKGYTPTVEGLGKLSDAYLSIQDPLQRTRFLVETFGRSGLEMGKLMELGSKKIEAMGKEIENTGLIMTKQGIQNAQDYHDALDKLGEVGQSVALILGGELAPAITGFAKGLTGLIGDVPPLIKMFIAMQEAMEAGGATLWDVQEAMIYYMTVTKTGAEITAEFERKALDANAATWTFTDSLLRNPPAVKAATEATDELGDSVENVGERAIQTTSDLARMAQQAKIEDVEIGLDFKFPNFADKMKNLMDSIDWQAAGGGALEKFMEGFASRVAPLTEDQKKKVAAHIGAVDVALRVDTGEITKWEGIQEIKDLFKEAGEIVDTTAAQNLIDKISSMTVPDISAYLNDIVRLAAPETAFAAATNTSALDTSTKSLGMSFTEYNPKAKEWVTTIGDIGIKSGESISNVQLLNAELAKIPENITVTVRVVTQGTIPKPRQTGGLTTDNIVYLVGERGPELFIPGGSGTIVPNYQTMNMLGNMLTVIPMAKGGKMNAKQEKELVQREKRRKRARWSMSGQITEDTDALNAATEAEIDTADLTTAYDYAVSLLRFSVAEYNTLVKSGASKAILADKKATIDLLNSQVVELARLRQAAALQQALKNTGDKLPSGIAEAVPWIDKIIIKFKELFGLLTGTTATTALNNLSPYFNGSVSQLAGPNYYSTSSMRNYNINVPVTATVNNGTDISRLAYAVAKEIAANVRQ